MYKPLTDEEIKSNIHNMLYCRINKVRTEVDEVLIELAIECLMNTEIDTIGYLTSSEVEVLRERFGINDNRTPKSLKKIGEKFNLTESKIKKIEDEALLKLLKKILYFKSEFRLDELKLSDNAKRFLFVSNMFLNFNELYIFFRETPNNNESNELQEIRDAFNIFKESKKSKYIKAELNNLLEDCGFSVKTYNCLKRIGINTFEDLIILFNDKSIYKIPYLGENGYKEIENFLFLKSNIEKSQNENNDVDDIQTEAEDLNIEDVLEKNQKDNVLIRGRIEKKEELLKKYKKVYEEKTQLLEKEKQLDEELKSIMEKIKSSYMGNENDRTKK